MGNDRSPGSQYNVWRHHNLGCSKSGNSELDFGTVIMNTIQTLKILCQFWLSASIEMKIAEETW